MTKEQKEKYKNKALEVIGSAGWTATIFSLTAMITDLTSSPDYLKYYTASMVIGTPVTYGAGKIIKKKIDEYHHKRRSHIYQMLLMQTQMLEPDYQITSIQTIFLNEINKSLKDVGINSDEHSFDEIMNINQFIYLINSNYYEKIKEKHQHFSREKLVRLLTSQVSKYYSGKEEIIFDEKNAKEILNGCFFISEEDKKEIYKEFKKSKIKINKTKKYAITRNDIEPTIKAYAEKSKEERNGKTSMFDINNRGWYANIIDFVANNEQMQEWYGRCDLLKWDVVFLQKVVKLIAIKYKEKLIEQNENYTNFNLVATLVETATSYAMVNNRYGVEKEEILNAFRHWDYVPFNIQLEILDDIFLLEDLDYDMHPYGINKNSSPKTKVIKLEEYKTKAKK